ncbi:Arm DNA-binding domain-containing protein [Shewanella sp. NFH-SH190041]|uniref:Arm DNA-binding domain-containing protein n=1 Tax=Shewanella sp. NFH-SH190041 TaxID=2950245 RepID=UPI0021C31728|nr:Arm DNA-binding domain-containing protein [Shewanella sp. NFH-SH190041]
MLSKAAKITEKRYRIADFGHRESVNGLILEVLPSGKKVFRFRGKHLGKDTSVTIGEFPAITIEQARRRAKQIASDFAESTITRQKKRLNRSLYVRHCCRCWYRSCLMPGCWSLNSKSR